MKAALAFPGPFRRRRPPTCTRVSNSMRAARSTWNTVHLPCTCKATVIQERARQVLGKSSSHLLEPTVLAKKASLQTTWHTWQKPAHPGLVVLVAAVWVQEAAHCEALHVGLIREQATHDLGACSTMEERHVWGTG